MNNQDNPSIAMQMVHRRMQQKFLTPQLEQEIQNAKELELFLRGLKEYAFQSGGSEIGTIVKNEFYDQILANTGLRNYTKMFTKTGGVKFERVFARIEAALGTILSGQKQNYSAFMTGHKRTKQLQMEIDEICIQAVQDLGMKIYKEIDTQGLKHYYLMSSAGTQIKMDNKGFVDLGFKADLPETWYKLGNLFRQASFSLKNYSSVSNEYHAAFKHLQLGNTKIDRILVDTLMHLYDGKIAAMILKKIVLNPNAKEVQLHVQHIRQIYELTGLGQSGGQLVKYFVFNDPAGPAISVKSTAEIVKNILMNTSVALNAFDNYNTQLERDLDTVEIGSIIASYNKERISI